jgi:DNA-binding transcriptional regulator YiaG
MNYPDTIAKQRKQLGLTRVNYGKLFGVSQNTILNWETGVSVPDDYRIVIINQIEKKIEEQKKLQGSWNSCK